MSERTANGYAEVRTRLVSDKLDLPMDYRLTGKQGTWYAHDVIVDGVSLVMNYRSQFTKIIAESSFQELLRRLRNGPNRTSASRNPDHIPHSRESPPLVPEPEQVPSSSAAASL